MNSKGGVFGGARPPGAQKLLFLITIVIAAVAMCTRDGFAQTFPNQPPPQSSTSSRAQPTKTGASGKTTAGKTQTTQTKMPTTQSKSHHGGKQHGRGQGHGGGGGVGVGVGATIDLSGIGQRRAEPDPFAASGPPPLARTQEKSQKAKTTTKPHEVSKHSDFADVELTGAKAKSETAQTDPFTDVQLTGDRAKETNNPVGLMKPR
jgi:hypothetical protein